MELESKPLNHLFQILSNYSQATSIKKYRKKCLKEKKGLKYNYMWGRQTVRGAKEGREEMEKKEGEN